MRHNNIKEHFSPFTVAAASPLPVQRVSDLKLRRCFTSAIGSRLHAQRTLQVVRTCTLHLAPCNLHLASSRAPTKERGLATRKSCRLEGTSCLDLHTIKSFKNDHVYNVYRV